MKKLLLLICLLPCLTFAQITIQENFNFSYFGHSKWFGDSSSFCSNNALFLCDSVAAKSTLIHPSRISEDFEISFSFKFSFNPSSSNNAKIIIASDQALLDSSEYAFYLCLACSGQDEIALWQKEKSNHTLLAQTTGILNASFNEYTIKLQRDSNSFWRVELNDSLLFMTSDNLDFQSNYLSWSCKYTKTRADKIKLDSLYFSGFPRRDNSPPTLDSLAIISNKEITLYWSEALNTIYKNQLNAPLEIDSILTKSSFMSLKFKEAMQSGNSYYLSLKNIEDTAGNDLDTLIYWDYYAAQLNDIIITELMIDPNPIVKNGKSELLGREYLELFNKRSFGIDLAAWKLLINDDSIALKGYIKAYDYLLLSKDSILNLLDQLNYEFIEISASQLNNQSFKVALLAPNNKLIDWVDYDLQNFKAFSKHLGGWSLEKLDFSAVCKSPLNWAYSKNQIGGSPGEENSQALPFQDILPPVFLSKKWVNQYSTFSLQFSEEIFLNLTFVDSIVRNTDYLSSISVEDKALVFELENELDSMLTLKFDLSNKLEDCSGNHIENFTFKIGRPTQSAAQQLRINEILFDPQSGVSEFIEFKNFSPAWIDLSILKLAYAEAASSSLFYESYLSEEQVLLGPNEIIAFCENVQSIETRYCRKEGNLIEQDFLNMDNTALSLKLMTSDMKIIDSLSYHKNMHSSLIQDTRGVSLERIPQGYNQNKNWQSARLNCGGASPGYENSFAFYAASEFTLDYDVFSPNNDFYRDQLIFRLKLEEEVQLRLKIYSINGEIVRDLVEGEFQRGSLNYFWEGTDNDGRKCSSGIYIAIAEFVDSKANRRLIRKSIILDESE